MWARSRYLDIMGKKSKNHPKAKKLSSPIPVAAANDDQVGWYW